MEHKIPRTTVETLNIHGAGAHWNLSNQLDQIAKLRRRSPLDVISRKPKVTPDTIVAGQKERIRTLLNSLGEQSASDVQTVHSNGKEFQELKPPVFIEAMEFFRKKYPHLVEKMESGSFPNIEQAQIEFRETGLNCLDYYAWDTYAGDPAESNRKKHLMRLGVDLVAGDCMNTLAHALGRENEETMINAEYRAKSFAFNNYWEGNNRWPGKRELI